MRLTLSLFGHEVICISTEAGIEYEDEGGDLSGGYLGSERVEVGPTDRYMGFSNGRECE